ncbi:PAS domain S-box protein [Rubrobacter indicoceani]|uniref:PAS domain S-box protein n=1 Tax=Rubrobacter indicoceani TaxID=2051957 RepID=UPI001F08DF94|nr:PAS domain S-box protein [Rubrobacter indicoceani]
MSGGDDFILSLKSVTSVFLRRFWFIALAVIVTVGLAMMLSMLQTPQYESSVRMLVGQDQGITESPNEAVGLQQLTQTMAVAADSRPVAQAVIDELNLDLTTDEFFENLTVEQVSSTQFIEIIYRSPDPQEAQRIANATGEAFSEQISQVSEGSTSITAVLYEPADLPVDPVVPDFFRNAALSLILGLMLGAGIAFLLELLDDRWSSPEEAEGMLGVPVFGVIPVFEPASGEGSQKIREAFRQPHQNRRRIAGAGEGSSSTDGSEPGLSEGPAGGRFLPPAGEGGVTWPVGTLLLDEEGRVEEADATLLGMLGRKGAEGLVGEEFSGLFSHPDDAERHRGLHGSLVSGERPSYSLEKRLIGDDGQISWVEVTVLSLRNAAGRGAMAMVKDITRVKQAEEAANISGEARRISEERLRTVMGHSPLSVSFFTPDGYSLSEDESWQAFWHDLWYEPGETNGESVLENERMRDVGLDHYFRQSIDSGAETVTPPLRLDVPEDGNGPGERWLRAFIRPVADERGGVREVMMMLEDLTDRKLIEYRRAEEGATLEELQAALQQKESTLRHTEESLRSSEAESEATRSRLQELEESLAETRLRSEQAEEENRAAAEEQRQEFERRLEAAEFEGRRLEEERTRLEGELGRCEELVRQNEERLETVEAEKREVERRLLQIQEKLGAILNSEDI